MHPLLAPLPDVLLFPLGSCSGQEFLTRGLKRNIPSLIEIRQPESGEPYTVRVPAQGFDLMLQCVNLSAPRPQRMWGLHSFTLHTAASGSAAPWRGGWLAGLKPEVAEASDVVSLLAPCETEPMATPGLVCGALPGLHGQPWAVLFSFHASTRKLQTLTVARTGEWVAASALPPWQKQNQ